MNKKDLSIIKKQLIKNKAEFLNKINAVKRNIDDKGHGEVGDEIDAAVSNNDKEIFFGLTETVKITMDEINEALGKIEKGIYGKCECCGKEIDIKRLKSIPWSRYCIQCQEEAERPKNVR
jgi:DnaK suppressor protein